MPQNPSLIIKAPGLTQNEVWNKFRVQSAEDMFTTGAEGAVERITCQIGIC